jgi:integrase
MSRLTLTTVDLHTLLQASGGNPRDHLLFSIALGTGRRVGEVVGLNVGDKFLSDGRPQIRKIAAGFDRLYPFTPCATVRSLPSIRLRAISSWHSDSLGMCRR